MGRLLCFFFLRVASRRLCSAFVYSLIVSGSLPFLCAVSDDTQQALALTKRIPVVQSAMLREACPYYAAYYTS